MKTLKEVSELIGMSRRVIQEYEKAGLARTPETRNKYGYLLYDQAHIDRLWQIRFYRELGCNKKQIKAILEDPDYDPHRAMEAQLQHFRAKKQELEALITVTEMAEQTGITPSHLRRAIPGAEYTPYNLLVAGISSSIQHLRQTDAPALEEAAWEQISRHMKDILQLQPADPGSPAVQQQVRRLHSYLSPELAPASMVLSWILALCSPGTESAAIFDQVYGDAQYLYDALQVYCRQALQDPGSPDLSRLLEKLDRLRRQGEEPQCPKAQALISQLHTFLKQIRILAPEEPQALLHQFADLLQAHGSCQLVPPEQQEICFYIARAIQFYCCQQEETK